MENDTKEKPVIVSIIATKSNTGKTTLIEGLIKNLKDKSYRVGVLKHDAHKFDIDKEGKDTYRFRMAGADQVIISSPEKLAMIEVLQGEREIEDILNLFQDMQLILIEGFKNNRYPKIEVHRKEIDQELLYHNPNFDRSNFIAIASDEAIDAAIPVFDLNDISLIADFIESRFLRGMAT